MPLSLSLLIQDRGKRVDTLVLCGGEHDDSGHGSRATEVTIEGHSSDRCKFPWVTLVFAKRVYSADLSLTRLISRQNKLPP